MLFADWVIFILSVFMVAISALSTSKEDVMDAFTGGNSDLFKNKKSTGAESVFNKAMLIMGILFFIMILWSNSIDRFFN